jgi:N utilization substance protein B
MRTRSKARQRAVEALFEAEQRGVSVSDVFSRNPEVNDYAIEIAQLVELNIVRIDELISTYSQDWQISRMPAVDRAIVRIGVAELLYRSELETGVVISEAMEIAQNLSTPESAKFLNGLLSNIGAIRSNLSTL